MDILAHGLWTGALGKAANRKLKKPLNLKWAVFWGVAPDLFAFTIPFAVMFRELLLGEGKLSEPRFSGWAWDLAGRLYHYSHSLVVFAAAFVLVWLILRRPAYEMFGWLLHILIDIPTHSFQFYPTPFLWPFSDFKINGIAWSEPWFMIVNYTALLAVYLALRLFKPKQ